MNQNHIKRLENIFKSDGLIVRTTALRANNFCSKDITKLIAEGYLSKLRTGYFIKTSAMSELSEIELVSLMFPEGIISMFSATQIHHMSTVNPTAISITIPRKMRMPLLPEYPPIRVYKVIQKMYEVGIVENVMPNTKIKVYDRERTVCDFFRMRNKLGEDIALEVLKSYMSGPKNIQKLYEYAKILQIKSVIKPYVEALL
jgi:predicted transcriptional regulator of viral defense system